MPSVQIQPLAVAEEATNSEARAFVDDVWERLISQLQKTQTGNGWTDAAAQQTILTPPGAISETEDEFVLRVPIPGLDARYVYLYPSRNGILLEARVKEIRRHRLSDSVVSEVVEKRMTRDFDLGRPVVESSVRAWLEGCLLCVVVRKQIGDDPT